MRLRCKPSVMNAETEVRRLAKRPRRDRNSYDLTVGRQYVALGLGFWDEQVWVEIATEGDLIAPVPLLEFEIVDGRLSAFWKTRLDADGAVRMWPASFFQDNFHSRLADREPSALTEFARVRELLEAEDEGKINRLVT